MKLTVSDIPEEGLCCEAEIPLKLHKNARDVASVNLEISRFKRTVMIEGTIKISATLECGRCLNEFKTPLDLKIREQYEPAETGEAADTEEISSGQLDAGFYENDEINIPEIVREQVLLAFPMKPLCSEDCPGLCSECGKDLHNGSCGCIKDNTDPRLAPLKRLRESMNDRKE